MTWTKADLQKLKDKGMSIDDKFNKSIDSIKIPKQVKVSVEKNTIELYLKQLVQSGLIESYKTEYQFTDKRKFRFDWYIPSLSLGIEYDGLISEKSRHTTINGFSEDCIKLNLATILGYKVLRYTALNYKKCYTDIEKIKSLK